MPQHDIPSLIAWAKQQVEFWCEEAAASTDEGLDATTAREQAARFVAIVETLEQVDTREQDAIHVRRRLQAKLERLLAQKRDTFTRQQLERLQKSFAQVAHVEERP